MPQKTTPSVKSSSRFFNWHKKCSTGSVVHFLLFYNYPVKIGSGFRVVSTVKVIRNNFGAYNSDGIILFDEKFVEAQCNCIRLNTSIVRLLKIKVAGGIQGMNSCICPKRENIIH